MPRKRIIVTAVVPAILVIALLVGWIITRSMALWPTVTTDSYEVKIPSGWTVVLAGDSIIDGDCVPCLKYAPGKKATVLKSTPLRMDRELNFQFYLLPRAGNKDPADIFKGYSKGGKIAAKNVTGDRYYKEISVAKELGYKAGSKLYGYAFVKGSCTILIGYEAPPNKADDHKVVELLISTLKLK